MSPERRLQILGTDCVAQIHRLVASAPPPSPEAVEEIRQIFAPAVARLHAKAREINSVPARTVLPPPPGCLWLQQAAARLGAKPRTLYTWRTLDRGPAGFRHAGRVVYEITALDAYLAECKAADRHTNPALNPTKRAPVADIAIPRAPRARQA